MTATIYALIVGTISLIYLQYTSKKVVRRTKTGKRVVIRKINYTIPLTVSVLTWISVFLYQRHCINSSDLIPVKDRSFTLTKGLDSGSDSQRSFRMMRTGVSMPNSLTGHSLPDVFINTIT